MKTSALSIKRAMSYIMTGLLFLVPNSNAILWSSAGPAIFSRNTMALEPYGQNPKYFKLTFSEEFNNGLDSKIWNDHIWYDPTSDTKDYEVSAGALRIWPQSDKEERFNERILTTDGKYYQTYGYFEMEAKLPIGTGAWPAFWLLNHDDEKYRPEIDIMEAYPGDKTGYWASWNKHPIRYGASYYQNGNGQSGLKKTSAPLTGDLTAFHKYAVKWEPNRISFYFDGNLVHSSAVSMPKRMYILLDMQYGSASWNPDATTIQGKKNAFEVNYVRAWKSK